MNAAVCQNRGQPNTTRAIALGTIRPRRRETSKGGVKGVSLPHPTSDLIPRKVDTESPIQESSAAVAESEGGHPLVLAPASLILRSAVSNVKRRLFFNIELNGTTLLGMLDDGSVHSYLGKGVSKEFAGKLEQDTLCLKIISLQYCGNYTSITFNVTSIIIIR